ncbi:hypothetical protein BDY19DRAFT_198002 [Irpex rosettiformis]|uniref:Uncharacterized protein n=1 Tax=Irpex rosettiformis TaxID=378272 RepID=A0ACB8U244_9APHY|nr:hypothetical protein BDY19DRAFT_198002 [Irpex rosettiformis]
MLRRGFLHPPSLNRIFMYSYPYSTTYCPLPSPVPSSGGNWSATGTATPYLNNVPLPPDDPVLNDVLAAGGQQKPAISFDLRRHPRYIRLSTANRSIPSETLQSPACRPKLAELSIRHPALPWRLQLRTEDAYLTVEQLLRDLYAALQTPITEDEWDYICKHKPAQARSIEQAAQYRRETPVVDRKLEESVRRKRVDALGDEFIFAGVQWSGEGVLLLNTVSYR